MAIDQDFADAYATHWRAVLRFALAWSNDIGAAEDLAQDAYTRLWVARERVDWSTTVLPWLLVAVRRLATDRFRALRRTVRPTAKPQLDADILAAWLDVQSAMAVLSPLERCALVLTALEGWTYADAADLLKTNPGALRAAVSRARHKLEAER